MRTNTPQDIENELFRRSAEVSGIANRLKAIGATKRRTTNPAKSLHEVLASLDTT